MEINIELLEKLRDNTSELLHVYSWKRGKEIQDLKDELSEVDELLKKEREKKKERER